VSRQEGFRAARGGYDPTRGNVRAEIEDALDGNFEAMGPVRRDACVIATALTNTLSRQLSPTRNNPAVAAEPVNLPDWLAELF
jgi:hypothetical protein